MRKKYSLNSYCVNLIHHDTSPCYLTQLRCCTPCDTCIRVASSACSFLLYCELFSDRELFTNCELCYAHTSAPPHMIHALHVASSACSFSIVLWTLFWPWTLYQPWTPLRTHFSSAPCNACTMRGELSLLFFYCTVNSFRTPTPNHVAQARICVWPNLTKNKTEPTCLHLPTIYRIFKNNWKKILKMCRKR